jgi:hypothetical protein
MRKLLSSLEQRKRWSSKATKLFRKAQLTITDAFILTPRFRHEEAAAPRHAGVLANHFGLLFYDRRIPCVEWLKGVKFDRRPSVAIRTQI